MTAVPLSFITQKADNDGRTEGIFIPRAPGCTFRPFAARPLSAGDGLSLFSAAGVLFPILALL